MKKVILGMFLLSSVFILTACSKKEEVNNMQENIENNTVEEMQNEIEENMVEEGAVNTVVEETIIENTVKPATKKTPSKNPVKKEETKKVVEVEQAIPVVEEPKQEEKKVYSKDELRSMIYKDTDYLEELKKTKGNIAKKNQLYIKYLKNYEAKYNK